MSDIEGGSQNAPSPAKSAGSGLPENVAGALTYLLGPITGVAFFILDRERPFVRFHAVQCIALCIVGVVLSVVLTVVDGVLALIPILGWLVGLLLSLGIGLAGFALWIWLMLQAYQGKKWGVPVLAPHVLKIAAETGASEDAAA